MIYYSFYGVRIVVDVTMSGYSAYAPEFPGIVAAHTDRRMLLLMMRRALESTRKTVLPKNKSKKDWPKG